MRLTAIALSIVNLLLLCIVAFTLLIQQEREERIWAQQMQREKENTKSRIRIVTEEQILSAKKEENKVIPCLQISNAKSLKELNPLISYLNGNGISFSMIQKTVEQKEVFGVIANNISFELNSTLENLVKESALIMSPCEGQ